MTSAQEYTTLQEELTQDPTVESGIIDLLVWVRHVIEANAGDESAMRELAQTLDSQCAEMADAIIQGTPAEQASADRAAQIQAEADTDG